MTQKDLFNDLAHGMTRGINTANLSLASALTLSTNNQVVFEVDNEAGEWKATGEIPPAPTVELVDLGLSVKWAKYNLGATHGDTPESWYGNYYAWGETETKSNYDWSTYKFGTESALTKYNSTDGKTVLESDDDVACVEQSLRMPTKAEFEELINNTTKQWVTDYNGKAGLNGYTFTANGNTLFIPAAGGYDGSERYVTGERGCVWSASLYSDDPDRAFLLGFYSDGVLVGSSGRYGGLPVRGVQ